MDLRQFVIDAWSWLNYKPVMATAGRPGDRAFPELAAYKVLASYDNNQAGQLAAVAGDDAALERRELGDAANLVDTALAYLLGSEQKIVVEGAEHADEDAPAAGAVEAAAVQERLRTWAEKELLSFRMQQAERAAVLLGDGVMVLAWDPVRRRPTLRVHDPGFFFPQWADEDEDFPARVHLAWELPEDEAVGLKARVRRVTYELGPVAEDTEPAGDAGGGGAAGVREYPWDLGRASNVTCYLTDAEWLLEDIKRGQTLDQLPADKAAFRVRPDGTELNRLDLMIDFVPVAHLANTIPAAGEHWGRSALARVLQGLDELAATDSDGSAASATTGTPIIGLAGARLPVDRATGRPERLTVEAGAVWQLGETGRMDALDTSPQLAELRARVDHLLDRIAANSGITAAGLGTLDASEVPSGYALKLVLGPLDALTALSRSSASTINSLWTPSKDWVNSPTWRLFGASTWHRRAMLRSMRAVPATTRPGPRPARSPTGITVDRISSRSHIRACCTSTAETSTSRTWTPSMEHRSSTSVRGSLRWAPEEKPSSPAGPRRCWKTIGRARPGRERCLAPSIAVVATLGHQGDGVGKQR